MESKSSNYLKVGIFVLLGLVVASGLIFVIGNERHMFQRKITLHASFPNVGGLRAGSVVTMGGVDIGSVTAVHFPNNPNSASLSVDFTVVESVMSRIRRRVPSDTVHIGSLARIASKGLLGDKALDITAGDIHLPEVHEGEWLPGDSNDELASLQATATNVANQISVVTTRLETATRPLQDNPALVNDILGLAHDLHQVSTQIATGNGTMGRLLRDPQMADDVAHTLASTQASLRNVDRATAQAEGMMHDARTGNGLIHALIYDPEGARTVNQLGHTADEVAAILHDVRTGNGGMHEIIYGHDSAQAVANINQATASARDILRDVQRGRGTIGALLVDPSLYDDVKSLVGNLQRNEILRAMVRYSIHASERDAQPTPRATLEPQH